MSIKVEHIDQIQDELGVCPYDSSHTFAKHKYVYHIHRCKIGKKLGHMFRTCRFNHLHIVPKQEIEQHENQCPCGTTTQLLISDIYDIIQTQRIQNDRTDIYVKEQDVEQEIKDEVKIEEIENLEEEPTFGMRIYGQTNQMEVQGWNQQQEKASTFEQQQKQITVELTTRNHNHNPFKDPLQKCKFCLKSIQRYLLLEPRDTIVKDLLTQYCLII